ncbi:MAG: hypothetical protein HRF45_03990 [Fimbriimonadia bacterium]|jgi:hypothetical protein
MLWLFGSLLLLGTAVQGEPVERREPGWLLNQVFPNPTGENGIEDFLVAAETLGANRGYQRLQQLDAEKRVTLQDKRRAIASCKAVLTRVRVGLARKNFLLRENVDWNTPLIELGHYRQLARLLYTEQEVHFADGRERQAIGSFQDGYRLGQVIEQKLLLAGLVGKACRALSVSPLARRLDQLDYEECKYLRKVCEELLEHQSDLADIITGEIVIAQDFLARAREDDFVDLLQAAAPTLEDDADDPERDALYERMTKHPELFEQDARRVGTVLREFHRQLLAELEKPFWERSLPEPEQIDDSSWASAILEALIPSWSIAFEQFCAEHARLQLLAVHAAILEYRWMYGSTPEDLSRLNLGDLVTDPFTGKPLIYKRLDDYRYKLYSAGPNKEDDGGNSDSDVVLVQGM